MNPTITPLSHYYNQRSAAVIAPLRSGFARLRHACVFSWRGLAAAFTHEAAFRQECYVALVLIPLGMHLGNSGVEKALLVSVILWVLITELINSAIEAVVDRIGTKRHQLAARAKDMSSAAVLVALINALFVWLGVLLL